MSRLLSLRVPGKLMLAGEYAVLEPHQPGLVVAVDRYVTATVAPAAHFLLTIPAFGHDEVPFEVTPDGVRMGDPDPRLRFVGEALAVVLSVCEVPPSPFHLTLESGLDDPDGRKYGLGGSAAAVTAAVAAVAHWVALGKGAPAPLMLFKLAAIAHFRAQGSGSGADVAASCFGGWLRYTSFNPAWLAARLARGLAPSVLLAEPWPFLSIERLSPLPRDLRLCVGWTGEPASTKELVAQVAALRERDPSAYEAFLADSQHAVEHLVAGLQSANRFRALDALTRNREALRRLGEAAGVAIETPALARLAELAVSAGGAGKLSGAGGGDCGIALVFGDDECRRLETLWREAGLAPLRLGSSDAGVAVTRLVP
ncbi:MAG: phosphomevalonate kinase [Candidatus Sericytochromatia bacterium]|nr:phosphomevalonate kinase [Candidatus Sericytochromatia bacterium]